MKVVKNLVSRYLNLRNIAGGIANSVGIVTSLWSIKSWIPVGVPQQFSHMTKFVGQMGY